MVVSQIRSLYRDDNDRLHTVIKRIWEEWDDAHKQWDLKKIEFLFQDPDLPLPSDNPAATVEARHGWIVPPEWEFISEVWAYQRKPESEITYDHTGEVTLLDGETSIIREE